MKQVTNYEELICRTLVNHKIIKNKNIFLRFVKRRGSQAMCESWQNFLLRFTDGWLRIMGHEVFLKQILEIVARRLKQKLLIHPQNYITSHHITHEHDGNTGNRVANGLFCCTKWNIRGSFLYKLFTVLFSLSLLFRWIYLFSKWNDSFSLDLGHRTKHPRHKVW
jgi:hypothetical protein